MRQSERQTIFVKEVHTWFKRHKRSLPWRDLSISNDTERAYQILVSEIMLQQTQVERVKIVFKNFIQQFPTIADLAGASNGDVLMAWRGMGYNSRALRLRNAAQYVVKQRDMQFPTTMKDLQQLPGVGHYTAAAIRNFAYNVPTACLDTNIRRIYHRTFVGPERSDGTWEKNDKYLLIIADKTLKRAVDEGFSAADWHAALMDFGSLVCTARNPQWDICPLTKAGIMKAAHKVPVIQKKVKKEPGRIVGSTYIPNRIFRGKFIEELRDAPEGLLLEEIGRRICIDWNSKEHTLWLQSLAEKLKKDHLIRIEGEKILLSV